MRRLLSITAAVFALAQVDYPVEPVIYEERQAGLGIELNAVAQAVALYPAQRLVGDEILPGEYHSVGLEPFEQRGE